LNELECAPVNLGVGHRAALMEANVELNEQAEALMQDERWPDAIALIQSNSCHETDGELSWNLGWAYFKLGHYGAAELNLKRATQLTPMRAASWWALGAAQQEQGLLEEAEGNLKHALTLRDSSISRLVLALVLMERGKVAEAEQVHLTGLDLQPESSERWESYAVFLDDVGRLPEAESARKKARHFGCA
jgi:Flp pilus assembly protein TadD